MTCWSPADQIISVTGIVVPSLRFLRIPLLCFPIFARATTFNVCLITGAYILVQSTTGTSTTLKNQSKSKDWYSEESKLGLDLFGTGTGIFQLR